MDESSSQVDSDLDIPSKNGKRGAEVVEPQVVGSKKQKIINDDLESINEELNSPSLLDQEQQLNKVEVPSSITTIQDTKKASSCNEFEQDDHNDNSIKENDSHMRTPMETFELPPAIKSATTQDAERASISNEHEEEHRDDKPKEIYMATDIEDANRDCISNEHEEEDRYANPKEGYMALERTEHLTTTSLVTGSKTLYLGNLSFAIEEEDVRDFFKDVGEIAAIRFVIRDERFLGYGYIEFATAEAAQEALKLNREVLLDRQVRLDLMRERGSYTPRNSMEKFNQRGVQGQGKTIFIRGFDPSDGFDNIKSALEKHFEKCGEISRMSIPKDYEAGAPKGIAFVDFVDRNGVMQALQLDGSEVAGCRLTVEEARRQKGDVREGSGYGVRGWSHGSGSGGGWVRDGISASTSGRGNGSIGGWGRENASGSGSGSVKENVSGGGSHREGGDGSSSCRISGFGSDSRRISGSGSSWHREHTSGSSWHRESVSGSTSHKESGYGRGLRSEGSSSYSWHRESGFGGGWRGGGGDGRGWGNENGYGHVGVGGRERGYGCGGGRQSGYGRGGVGGTEIGYGRGGVGDTEIGYGRGGFGSSLGYRGGRSGSNGRGFSSSHVGAGSGWGGGSGYSSSRMGRISGGYGSGRGGGFSRP